ncbi:MAG TPA: helix-turn-helix domain-containing protein [Caulobacteraceae bacterium]|nr:helix-turn-helix domain-containing protein [Caulobacteraceae bacterium]
MPRNRDDVRARLQQAGLELFAEHCYDATTAAEIAARAGVTERTFFRHFADKREILFDEDPGLRPALTAAVAAAPQGAAPMAILAGAFASLEPMLLANRPFTEPRIQVIAANPALIERAEAKAASLTALLATALQQRGVEPKLAGLAARAAMAAFSYATTSWREDPSLSLAAHLDRAFQTLHGLSSPNLEPGS